MIGAIAGDIIGSPYEFNKSKPVGMPLFLARSRATDDSVLTIALAESILTGEPYTSLLKRYARTYPDAGYGGTFFQWAHSSMTEPYHSWGNGSAMRVSPVGWAYNTLDDVMEQAEKSAAVTHNHPEGIKGAQAVASAIFLARTEHSKAAIKTYITDTFQYDLSDTVENLRQWYTFDVSCQGSVPQAFVAFLESDGYEDAIRKAISIGGDSDTIACMVGGIAQAFYGGVPEAIQSEVYLRLDADLTQVVRAFCAKYNCG